MTDWGVDSTWAATSGISFILYGRPLLVRQDGDRWRLRVGEREASGVHLDHVVARAARRPVAHGTAPGARAAERLAGTPRLLVRSLDAICETFAPGAVEQGVPDAVLDAIEHDLTARERQRLQLLLRTWLPGFSRLSQPRREAVLRLWRDSPGR